MLRRIACSCVVLAMLCCGGVAQIGLADDQSDADAAKIAASTASMWAVLQRSACYGAMDGFSAANSNYHTMFDAFDPDNWGTCNNCIAGKASAIGKHGTAETAYAAAYTNEYEPAVARRDLGDEKFATANGNYTMKNYTAATFYYGKAEEHYWAAADMFEDDAFPPLDAARDTMQEAEMALWMLLMCFFCQM